MVVVRGPIHTNACISVYRKYTDGSSAYEYTKYPIIANHKVYIYESNNDYQNVYEMSGAVQTLKMNTCNIDIRENDKIIDDRGYTYITRYIKRQLSPYTDFLEVELHKDGFDDKYK